MSDKTVLQMIDAEIERIHGDAYSYGVPDWLRRARATIHVLDEVANALEAGPLRDNHSWEAEQFRAIMRKIGGPL